MFRWMPMEIVFPVIFRRKRLRFFNKLCVSIHFWYEIFVADSFLKCVETYVFCKLQYLYLKCKHTWLLLRKKTGINFAKEYPNADI